ncbi:E3 ubiquitin-protein ligase TRIM39-like isoform X1 [Hemiscyllium ocellatum]|uniref:E3 ubiquitin-protein ligase TRIM39-like isoform X1 n=2 Tax=Hemiscyllium ocellatum TaxID=170820 RepID=UPI002967182B|nr:E3 ubiquitin-protein ligase TRIM39-like isoform X1 [Hemiscyllium ocellatum]
MTLQNNQGSILSNTSGSTLGVQCVIHSENLILYCNECEDCVCPRCLVGNRHKTHTFSPFEEACKEQKFQIRKKVKDLKKIHDQIKKEMVKIPLTLNDIEIIISKTKESVEEKYNILKKLLDNDMRVTMSLIEAERLSMETIITEQQVDKEAYSDAIISLMERFNDISENPEPETVQELQEVMSWKARLEAFEDLQRSIGKEMPAENGRLKSLVRSVEELQQAVKKLLPRMWQYSRNITFAENTAHRNLSLSSDLRSVQYNPIPTSVQDNSARFEYSFNVLANESFSSGKHYWEVKVRNKDGWNIGVTYCSISRKGKGKETVLGKNKYSWSIQMVDKEYYAVHADESILLDLNSRDHKCERLGIFVDYEEGRLSFYNVNRGTHIHSFKTKFRKPIFPAFNPVSTINSKNYEPIVLCHLVPTLEEIADGNNTEIQDEKL